ncbi:MAG TPA: TIR domain-containing protein [Phenylobacterium sp.]|jgi:TolB-like protein
MSDIFISYARPTASEAQRIAESLRALGYSVWRDDELPAHRAYSEVIEERLRSAKAVLVIWCAEATRSHWVRAEADAAREAGTLVQISLDGVTPPMPFNQIQCAPLSDWNGDADAPGWRKVVSSISELVGGAPSPRPKTQPAAPKPAAEPLLAVLAFDNLSGDAEMAYFSDGVSEEIQETVARGADLKVIGRTSSFQLRGADKTVRRAATELKATHVLDGSVRRSGQRVRISAQLIECAGETTLWSNRFDRDLTDIFALQDEIATAVAAAMKIAFAPAAQPQAVDPAAYDLYLKARAVVLNPEVAINSRNQDPRTAIALYEQAVGIAPGFAAAWAGLGNARAHLLALSPPDQSATLRTAAREAIETALKLDPGCGLAYSAQSLLEPLGHHAARERLLRRALEVSPNDPELFYRMDQHLFQVGRIRESMASNLRARELDPFYAPAAYSHAALVEIAEGRYEESQRLFDEFRDRWPDFIGFTTLALNMAAWHQDWVRFDALAKYVRDIGPQDKLFAMLIRIGEAVRNPDPETLALVSQGLRNQLERTGSIRLDSIAAAMALGLKEEVLAAVADSSFANAFEEGVAQPAGGWSPGLIFMMIPNAELIRDVRFVGLCAKLGHCHYWVETDQWPDCAALVDYDFKAEARRLAAETVLSAGS